MEWNKLINTRRLGKSESNNQATSRTEFQRDYDRLIFSSPFRRLQNKTQVFPLPGSVFVHNRLTHSLEVASIGRSLGNLLVEELDKRNLIDNPSEVSEIGSIIATACLAHDMGNPPFGHSGEKAISRFFSNGKGQEFKHLMDPDRWQEFENFEGNANAFRLLTHQFNGRREGGFALTYSSLSAVVKYPFSVFARTKKNKYGFFNSEKETFIHISEELGVNCLDKANHIYSRHPLVYLVEAADDIAYQIMDIEDAQKLKILDFRKARDIYLNFFENEPSFSKKVEVVFNDVTDKNEQLAYLRASVINKLVHGTIKVFIDHYRAIMNGEFQGALTDQFNKQLKSALDYCASVNFKDVYNHHSVIKIELTGYNIINSLLEEFVPAALYPDSHYAKKLISLLPNQFSINNKTAYENIQSIVDFISGMTDLYATDLYRDIKGINRVI